MPRRSDKSLVPSGVAVAPKIDVSCRNSNLFAASSSSLPTSPQGAPKRVCPSSLLSSSRSSPRAATSSASAASFSRHERHSDGSSSSDAADCDGPAPSASRRIRRRVVSASSAPAHPLPLLRSASSDSYFVSAINRNPSICLFAALSPRSDFSLLCDDSVLSALSEDPPSSNPHSLAATTAQLKPLSRLKVRAATSVLLTLSCSHPAHVTVSQAAVLRTVSSLRAGSGVGGGTGSASGGGAKRTRSSSYFVNVTWQATTLNDLHVALDATPARLKQQLETMTGVPADCQQLICRGTTLEDSTPLYATLWRSFRAA
jgi:hypothetical protein